MSDRGSSRRPRLPPFSHINRWASDYEPSSFQQPPPRHPSQHTAFEPNPYSSSNTTLSSNRPQPYSTQPPPSTGYAFDPSRRPTPLVPRNSAVRSSNNLPQYIPSADRSREIEANYNHNPANSMLRNNPGVRRHVETHARDESEDQNIYQDGPNQRRVGEPSPPPDSRTQQRKRNRKTTESTARQRRQTEGVMNFTGKDVKEQNLLQRKERDRRYRAKRKEAKEAMEAKEAIEMPTPLSARNAKKKRRMTKEENEHRLRVREHGACADCSKRKIKVCFW